MTTESAHRWASLEVCAEYLGTSQRTIRRMITAGDLTGYRIGVRLLRVDLNDVDRLMQSIERVPGGAE